MRALALCLGLCACGVFPVQLGTEITATPPNVVDTVALPPETIARLMSAEVEVAPEARLAFMQPAGELAVPANIAPLHFSWRSQADPGPMPPAPAGAMMPMPPAPGKDKASQPSAAGSGSPPVAAASDVYALLLQSEGAELLRLYTDTPSARVPAPRWRALLAQHVGRVLQVELRWLSSPSGRVLRAASPLRIEVRPAVRSGVVYAWSTTAQGLVQASLEHSHGEPLALASDESPGRCVGCHAAARDGSRLSAAVAGEPWLVQQRSGGDTLPKLEVPESANTDDYATSSYDPSGARIAVSRAGALAILDADSAHTLATASWPGMAVSYPDWSPDGEFIAVSLTTVDETKKAEPKHDAPSAIARIRVGADSSLGAPERLTGDSAKKDVVQLFPSYSPDGEWIAFEQRSGPGRGALTGSLWLVRSGGGDPIALGQAGHRMPADAAEGWPSWIPGATADKPWLLFNSTRGQSGREAELGQRQLFVSALDLTLAEVGSDPSLRAFWLPFQDPAHSYRRATWAPAANACLARERCDDEVDDDCDGRVDEDCCTAAPERCDDGTDEDCDGRSDEGCACSFREVCGGGVDDDCDGKLDEEPCVAAR